MNEMAIGYSIAISLHCANNSASTDNAVHFSTFPRYSGKFTELVYRSRPENLPEPTSVRYGSKSAK